MFGVSEMSRFTNASGRQNEEPPRKRVYQTPLLIPYGGLADVPTEDAARLSRLYESEDDGPDPAATTKTRVLVVDDDGFMRQVVRDDLEDNGFRVATAANGSEAFRVIPIFNPDVVVMDVIMPGENGYRVSRALKERASHRMVTPPKIVLVTGRRVDDDPEREAILLRFSRADAMLYKPCDPAHLRETIAKLLET
jgi:CheY-like chemotaxis protein